MEERNFRLIAKNIVYQLEYERKISLGTILVDKEDDLCEGKESGCMEIKELGDKLRERLLTCNVSS